MKVQDIGQKPNTGRTGYRMVLDSGSTGADSSRYLMRQKSIP